MEETGSSLKLSNTSASDVEHSMSSSLQDYYQSVMENSNHSSIKVERAAKFLLLPEISKLVGDHTKAMFLLSKGLTHDEVSEAFKYYYRKQKEIYVPNVPELALNNISQTISNSSNAVQRKYTNAPSGLSLFFNLCQRVMVLAGISTAFYYLYQKWSSDKAKEIRAKRENKRIEEELNQIKSELQKITAELKLQQMTGKTNSNLAAEINSLKAILVSRQHFEELQSKKVSLPSWQLNATNTSNAKDKNIADKPSVSNEVSEMTSAPSNPSPVDKVQEIPTDSAETEPIVKDTLTNDIQNGNQSSTESDEQKITTNVNGDLVSDLAHKTKKSNAKNKNSKSKINENGKSNLKQNGVRAQID